MFGTVFDNHTITTTTTQCVLFMEGKFLQWEMASSVGEFSFSLNFPKDRIGRYKKSNAMLPWKPSIFSCTSFVYIYAIGFLSWGHHALVFVVDSYYFKEGIKQFLFANWRNGVTSILLLFLSIKKIAFLLKNRYVY